MGTMADFNSAWIRDVERYLKAQVVRVQRQLAANALNYFRNFRYHAWHNGGYSKGYSYWYATHWRVWHDSPGVDGTANGRSHYNETKFHYGSDFPRPITGDAPLDDVAAGKAVFGHKTYITNSVGYGPWLNNGGWFGGTYWNDIMRMPAVPLHFVEKNFDGIKNTIHLVAARVRKENPSV